MYEGLEGSEGVEGLVAEVSLPAVEVTPIAEAVAEVAPVVSEVVTPVEVATVAEVAPVAETKKRGPKAAKRGAPPKFVGDIRKGIVKLLRTHKNASYVRTLLSSRQRDLIAERKAAGLEKSSISMPTLLKIAAKANIKLQVGRPVSKAA
jgi:hypothetical protein